MPQPPACPAALSAAHRLRDNAAAAPALPLTRVVPVPPDVAVPPAADAVPPGSAFESALYRKISRRLLPFLFTCYLFAYLDRVNVGFAKLRMAEALGFSDLVYGFGAGIFFVGYFFCEIPSNYLLHRLGARYTLTRIMALWGALSMATALVRTPMEFYLLRFLLGVAEAGFFPGVILYLTYWFPSARRGRIIALFVTAVALSSVIGAPLSGAIMAGLDGIGGLAGWQWLFLLEGLPSIGLGVLAWMWLDDRPEDADWLTPQEREHLAARLASDVAVGVDTGFGHGLANPRAWQLAGIYFSFVLGLYGLNFWLPTIVRDLGHASLVGIGLISAIPFAAAAVVMVGVGISADRLGERGWHTAGPALVGAAGLAASVGLGHVPALAILALTFGTCGVLAAIPQTWGIATHFLAGGAAASGIALINACGNLSGFVAPYAMGWLKTQTGSTASGILLIAAFQLLGALGALAVWRRRGPSPAVNPRAERN